MSIAQRIYGLLVTSLCVACGLPHGVVIHTTDATVDVEAVALNTVELRLPNTKPWQRYQKEHDILTIIQEFDRLDAVASWEYDQITKPESPAMYLRKTNLGPRMREFGISPRRVVVLDVTIEEETRHKTISMTLKRTTVRSRQQYNARIRIRASLLHPSSGRVLAHILRIEEEDRFAISPDSDSRPAVRLMLKSAVRDLLEAAITTATIRPMAPQSHPPMGLAVVENPAPVLTYKVGGPPLASVLKGVDAVLREARVFSIFRYFRPNMTLARTRVLLATAPGLIVKHATRSPLTSGDIIQAVNGNTVQWTFQWRRLWRRHRQTRLKVIRGKKQHVITIGAGD